MLVISRDIVVNFYTTHPETKSSLERWYTITTAAAWKTMLELKQSFSTVVILNGERARFEIAGGNYRLIVAFDFGRQVAAIKFLGTHSEYDRINALTI
jgi:mRNA interferase HigB